MDKKTPDIDLSAFTDLEIIELILASGKTVYFSELYDRYANKVYGKAIQMVKDRDLAQDLAHDILIKAFLKLNTFQGKSSFSTWLYQVSYTHCIDYIRKNSKMRSETLEEERFDTSASSGDDEVQEKILLEIKLQRLTEILEMINPEDKMFLLMKYQDRMSIKELAEQFDMSESAVKMKLKRIRDKVRSINEAWDTDKELGS